MENHIWVVAPQFLLECYGDNWLTAGAETDILAIGPVKVRCQPDVLTWFAMPAGLRRLSLSAIFLSACLSSEEEAGIRLLFTSDLLLVVAGNLVAH